MAGLFAFSAPAQAQQITTSPLIFDLVAGLFCAPAETGRRDAPGTLSGWVHVPTEPVEMVVETQQAIAQLGTGFGVSYRLRPGLFGDVTFRVMHPPIPPGGETQQSWQGYLEPGQGDTVFFQFDIPEELQPGRWVIAATLDGQALFSAEFDVLPPNAAPHLPGLCIAPMLLS